jgi:hypothetical protein
MQEMQPELRNLLLAIAEERAAIVRCGEEFDLDREGLEDRDSAIAALDGLEKAIWVGALDISRKISDLAARIKERAGTAEKEPQ